MNVYAWADEQAIWQEKSYQDPFGMLFYSKMGAQLEQVFTFKPYQRLKMTGVVVNTFQNLPWVEVFEFEPIGGQLDTATLTHLYRGEKFMQERQWQKAIAELTLAPGPDVPVSAQRAAYRNLGLCHLRIGESDQAVSCLRQAVALGAESTGEIERLLATAESAPITELDRTVGAQGLKDHERPMWEAFEKDTRTSQGVR